MEYVFDVAVIGGGINGCGCAADAALRGLSVILFEQDDLASKTSSSSTKLIHGGLRYLENYEFGLVKKALEERQTLLQAAPHLVHPQSLILPYQKHMRPSWLLRLGLFFYDHLSRKNHLPKCKSIQRTSKNSYFAPLINKLNRGFLFYDAATDDARLTIVNAIQAQNYGANIRPRTKVIGVKAIKNKWELTLQPEDGATYTILAKTIINAAGPWVNSIIELTQTPVQQEIALVKGSHILVPQLYEGKHAYFLQHDDKRVIFVIPYHGFSMIGTTDVRLTHASDEPHISDEEISYLTQLVNSYFKVQISKKDIVHTWSGIRPLLAAKGAKAQSLTRDYHFEFSKKPAPIVTIFGGKITTYRQLAEEIINKLAVVFPKLGDSKTKNTPLPGAHLDTMSFSEYIGYAKEKYPWLAPELLHRYLYNYGTNTEIFLGPCTSLASMGKNYGADLYQVEVDYLIQEEWAKDCEDILWRRTKLGLCMNEVEQKELERHLERLH